MAKGEDALAQLRDIHLPNPIQWWPLAPGWYVLIVMTLLLILSLVYLLYKRQRQARPKKQALTLLALYQKAYEKDNNSQITSARISELLRRVALVYFPRKEVASLYGDDWVDFLNGTSKNIDFQNLKFLLLEVPFKPSETINLSPLIQGAKSWIKQRRVPCSN